MSSIDWKEEKVGKLRKTHLQKSALLIQTTGGSMESVKIL